MVQWLERLTGMLEDLDSILSRGKILFVFLSSVTSLFLSRTNCNDCLLDNT